MNNPLEDPTINSQPDYAAIARSPVYRSLVRERSCFGWLLTGTMLVVYFGYILLIAFRKDLLALPISQGVTSLGIPLGLGVIFIGILLTGLYVRRANRHFDSQVEAIVREHRA